MKGMRFLRLLILVSFFTACKPITEQPPTLRTTLSSDSSEIHALIEKTIEEAPLASLSVAIQGHDAPPFAQGYGSADIESGIKANQETIYQIGSITKTFTAAAVMQLVEEGKLDLDKSVAAYVDGLPSGATEIHIRDILSHTSGLPNLEETSIRIDYARTYAPDEIIELLSADFAKLLFEPGSGFHYSNLGYSLLGSVIEEVSGLSYVDYLELKFFDPLGLNSVHHCDAVQGGVAHGYKVSAGELLPADPSNLSLAFAAGDLCASAADLLEWYANLSSGRVIGAEAFKEMTSQVVLADGTRLESGLGFIAGDFLGEQSIGSLGRTSGYEAFLVHFPADDLTIVVLCNTNPVDPFAISKLISSIRDILEGT